MTAKIIAREELAGIVRQLRKAGKTLVTTNGSFDLLHAGHVSMLQEAKSLGDVLIVGMNSDASVRRYKGRTRPICPQDQRAAMLAALACTDYVTIFDELTPIPLLEIIQPDIHVNSPEHGYDCVEREVVERSGGRIHLAQLVEGMSTTRLLVRITQSLSHEPRRGLFLAASVLSQEPADHVLRFVMQANEAGFLLFVLSPETPTGSRLKAACRQQGIALRLLPAPLDTVEQIDRLVDEHDLTLAKSLLISPSMADIQIGRQLNCKTILLENEPAPDLFGYASGPHWTIRSLQEALEKGLAT